ncbi:hypothetical protein ACX40Y_01265 [Sphingomonas sp. RS6]
MTNPPTDKSLDKAMDRMSVAPGPDEKPEQGAVFSSDAGTDATIEERLARNPQSNEARLDRALDESMDASDPPASTQPVHNNQAPESSGYDADAEARRAADRRGEETPAASERD